MLASAVLIAWSTIGADWWSTAITLDLPFSRNTPGITDLGRSLADGYPLLALGIIAMMIAGLSLSSAVLGPYAVVANTRWLIGVVAMGVVGAIATLVAAQLDSPFTGLVQTNGWIPAMLGWLFYFGALGFAMPARGPQLEFEPRPDSSDG